MCLAIPGKIKSFNAEDRTRAIVEVADVRREVNVDLVLDGGLDVGDWVLIHVGFAMSTISAEEAEEQLRLLDMMGETEAALEEMQGGGPTGDPYDPMGGKNPFEDDSNVESALSRDPPDGEAPDEPAEHEPLEEP